MEKEASFYKNLSDFNPAFISSFLPNGELTYVNHSLAAAAGKRPEEIIGQNMYDFMDVEEAKLIRRAHLALTVESSFEIHDQKMFYADGSFGYCKWKNSAFFDKNGAITHFIAVGLDDNFRKQMEDELRVQKEALEEAQKLACIGSWSWNILKDRVVWSPMLYSIAGYDPNEEPPSYAEHHVLYTAESFERLKLSVSIAIKDGAPFEIELDLVRKDGLVRPVIAVGRAVKNARGETVRLHGTVQDIFDRKEALSAKQNAEQFAQVTLNALSTSIAILNEEGVILKTNYTWRAFYEANKPLQNKLISFKGINYITLCENLIGEGLDEPLKMANGIRGVINGSLPSYSLEYPCHSDVVQRWFIVRVTPFDGVAPRKVVVAHEDITARKIAEVALRESEFRWKFALEGSGDGIWDWDILNKTVFFSLRWKEQLGFSESEIGEEFDEWVKRIHPDDLDATLNELRCLDREADESFSFEHRLKCKNGKWKWILSRGMVVSKNERGEATRMVGTHTDISKIKKNEIDLMRATKVANELAKNAQIANQTKSLFLANMSHEMRTPLNGVIGLAQLLLESKLDLEQRKYVELILNSGKSLDNLTKDILDITKIEENKLEIEKLDFDLRLVVKGLQENFKLEIENKKLAFICTLDPALPSYVNGDANRLNQVLNNLIQNAIKFTEAGTIALTVSLLKDLGKELVVRFEVKDTGVGIADNKHDLLFKLFSQLDSSTTRKYGGSGLGLALSEKLTKLMGGEIGVNSIEGKGSEFWFTVCFAKQGETMGQSEDVAIQQKAQSKKDLFLNRRGRILLVEDNKTNQLVTIGLLKTMGLRADIVENGLEAIQALQEKDYDLVLMDVQMPVMDGLEASRKIRTSDSRVRNNKIPIIALTAGAMVRDRENCLSAGMNDYLVKPLFAKVLTNALETWLPKKELDFSENLVLENELSNVGVEELPVFDKSGMMNRLGQNQELAIEVINAFLGDIYNELASLKINIDSKNYEGIELHAHSIKGSSAVVGGERLQFEATVVELYARDKKIDYIKKSISRLEVEIEVLTKELQLEL